MALSAAPQSTVPAPLLSDSDAVHGGSGGRVPPRRGRSILMWLGFALLFVGLCAGCGLAVRWLALSAVEDAEGPEVVDAPRDRGEPEAADSDDGVVRGSDPTTAGSDQADGVAKAPREGGRRGGTLRLPGGNPTTLDPARVRDIVSADYMYEIYSGLVTLSPELEVVPDLAARWDVSQDGRVYTFTLRPDARFHDGEPVVAEDLRYAIERACDPATASDVAGAYLDDVVGCTDKLAGVTDTVRGVRALGVDRVELTIDAPKAYFLAKLTYPTSFVVDRLQVESDPRWALRPNGTGPFRVDVYEPEERLRLERHERYHGDVAFLDAVEYDLGPFNAVTRYENDELDATPVGAFDLSRVSDPLNPLSFEVMVGPGDLGVTYIGFNTTRPPFDDPALRQAFNLAVDKRRVTDIALLGAVEPMGTILPPGMPGHDAARDPYGFNPAAARAALARSRYGGKDGLPPIVIHASGGAGASPSVQAVIDTIEESLEIDITVEQAPWELFQREVSDGVYDAWFLGWSADYPDPQDFLDVLFHSRSPLNATGFDDPETDALLEAARIQLEETERLRIYGEAETRILDAAPWVPLYTGVDTWLVKERVHGFFVPPIVVPRLAGVWLED